MTLQRQCGDEQIKIDLQRTLKERNKLGQYATPPELSKQIAIAAKKYTKTQNVFFLEPAIGTGSFFSAVLRVFGKDRIKNAKGFEIDKQYASIAIDNWSKFNLNVR